MSPETLKDIVERMPRHNLISAGSAGISISELLKTPPVTSDLVHASMHQFIGRTLKMRARNRLMMKRRSKGIRSIAVNWRRHVLVLSDIVLTKGTERIVYPAPIELVLASGNRYETWLPLPKEKDQHHVAIYVHVRWTPHGYLITTPGTGWECTATVNKKLLDSAIE